MAAYSRNAHRHHVSEKAHIRLGLKYTYNPLPVLTHGAVNWLKAGEYVTCCDTLDGDVMYCMVESLDGERSGKIHVMSLRLTGDFRRK